MARTKSNYNFQIVRDELCSTGYLQNRVSSTINSMLDGGTVTNAMKRKSHLYVCIRI